MSFDKCQKLNVNVNKIKLLSECTSGFPPVIFYLLIMTMIGMQIVKVAMMMWLPQLIDIDADCDQVDDLSCDQVDDLNCDGDQTGRCDDDDFMMIRHERCCQQYQYLDVPRFPWLPQNQLEPCPDTCAKSTQWKKRNKCNQFLLYILSGKQLGETGHK